MPERCIHVIAQPVYTGITRDAPGVHLLFPCNSSIIQTTANCPLTPRHVIWHEDRALLRLRIPAFTPRTVHISLTPLPAPQLRLGGIRLGEPRQDKLVRERAEGEDKHEAAGGCESGNVLRGSVGGPDVGATVWTLAGARLWTFFSS